MSSLISENKQQEIGLNLIKSQLKIIDKFDQKFPGKWRHYLNNPVVMSDLKSDLDELGLPNIKIANKDGFSDYSEGLEPNYNIKESILDFGVLGDIEEPLLSFAISLINGTETKFTLKNSAIPLNKVKDPLMISRQGMFLDKNTVPFLIN